MSLLKKLMDFFSSGFEFEKNLSQSQRTFSSLSILILYSAVAYLSYGLLVDQLGYYVDDLPAIWTYHNLGTDALIEHASGDRFFLGYYWAITISIFGIKPITWHILYVIVQLVFGLVCKAVFNSIFHQRDSDGILFGLLCVSSPIFTSCSIAFIFSQIFLLQIFWLLSVLFSLKALKQRSLFHLVVAIVFCLPALFICEYFWGLELFGRFPILLLSLLLSSSEKNSFRLNLKTTFCYYLPFFLIFTSALILRFTLFSAKRGERMSSGGVSKLSENPLGYFRHKARALAFDTFDCLFSAWGNVFNSKNFDSAERVDYLIVFLLISSLVAFLMVVKRNSIWFTQYSEKSNIPLFCTYLILGIWLTITSLLVFLPVGLRLELGYEPYGSRSGISAIIGSSMFLLGVSSLVFSNVKIRYGFLWIMIMLSSIHHFRFQEKYAHHWKETRQFAESIFYRVPNVETPVLFVIDEDREGISGKKRF